MGASWNELIIYCSRGYLYEGELNQNILFSLPNNIVSVYEDTHTYFMRETDQELNILVWLNPNQLNLGFLFDLLSTTDKSNCVITIVSSQSTTYICSWYDELAIKIPANWNISFAKTTKHWSVVEFILTKNQY